MEFQLTNNQKQIFDTIEASHQNFLVCGEAGVGKSVLIKALVEDGRKTYTLAAPTGLAALNIGGRTLHSIFRIPISQGVLAPDFNVFNETESTMNFIKYQVKALIIDEMSMVRADIFDYIDRYCQHVKGNSLPFGGIQIIIIGDFYQLSPVVVKEEKNQMKDSGYDSPFLFSSRAFQSFQTLFLNEVLRQKGDLEFVKVLKAARDGSITAKQTAYLNQRVGRVEDLVIQLAGTNAQADQINNSYNFKLDASTKRIYKAVSWGDWPVAPAPEFLDLRIGSQVMVRMNGADRPMSHTGTFESQVVNGTIGKVVELLEDRVMIEISGGAVVPIYIKQFERKVKSRTEEGWTEVLVASYKQIPLALAWAISIHKSQGQTFERVHIDAKRIFAAGQLYVALSRCKTLAGITFEHPLKSTQFWPDKKVIEFFNSVEV